MRPPRILQLIDDKRRAGTSLLRDARLFLKKPSFTRKIAMPGRYAIVARFVAKPECAAELRNVLLDTAKLALEEEPGCRGFEILQGADAAGNSLPDVFMTNELFDDFAAVEAHRNSWRTPIRIRRIRELVASAGRVEMAIVQQDDH